MNNMMSISTQNSVDSNTDPKGSVSQLGAWGLETIYIYIKV